MNTDLRAKSIVRVMSGYYEQKDYVAIHCICYRMLDLSILPWSQMIHDLFDDFVLSTLIRRHEVGSTDGNVAFCWMPLLTLNHDNRHPPILGDPRPTSSKA